jgi:hypothetical protein
MITPEEGRCGNYLPPSKIANIRTLFCFSRIESSVIGKQAVEKLSRSPSTSSGRTGFFDIIDDFLFMVTLSKHSEPFSIACKDLTSLSGSSQRFRLASRHRLMHKLCPVRWSGNRPFTEVATFSDVTRRMKAVCIFFQVPCRTKYSSSSSLGFTGMVLFLSFLKCTFEFVQQSSCPD